jgi:hypothetical protein
MTKQARTLVGTFERAMSDDVNRVNLQVPDEITIPSSAASDLAHTCPKLFRDDGTASQSRRSVAEQYWTAVCRHCGRLQPIPRARQLAVATV